MAQKFDMIVIGGGPNGLECAAYLAKAGQKCLLLEKRFSGAPVVNATGKLVGVLAKKDCLKTAMQASYYEKPGGLVAEYMNRDVETLDADMELFGAAEAFLESRYRRFPVLREGRLVGQISRADLLRALVEQWH